MLSTEKIKVLIVDDHPLMRVGIAAIIDGRPGMMTVAQAGTGEEAVTLYERHLPDITLMDLRLPQMSGVEAIRNIRRDGNDQIKKAAKDKLISADDEKRASEEVQQLTDAEIKRIEDLCKAQEKEIMTV